MEELRKIAEKVLSEAKAQGADFAQCSLRKKETKEFNIDSGAFSLMRTLFDRSLTVQVYAGGRQGAVSVNRLSESAVPEIVAEAMAAAESSAPDPAWEIDRSGRKEQFVKGSPECDTEKLFMRTREFLETIGERFPKLLVEQMITDHEAGKSLYVNSFGTSCETVYGAYSFYAGYSAHEGASSSHSYGSSGMLQDLGRPFIECAMAEQELQSTQEQACPVPLAEKFVGTVIFTPECLRDVVMGTILGQFVSDRALIDGTSPWKDKIGKTVASEAFSLALSPHHPKMVCGPNITPEGYPTEDFDVIRDGVLEHFVLSQYGANKTGLCRSGNTSGYLVVPPGNASLAEMIAQTEKGIVIGRFSGGSPTANGEFSGVAKNSFLVENGKITCALSETMVSANLLTMLRSLKAVSREVQENGTSVMPYMAFDGITISGK